jgi:hypothetical protein
MMVLFEDWCDYIGLVNPFGRVNLARNVSTHDYVIEVVLSIHAFSLF